MKINYFIQVTNHIDNTIKIIDKITNLDTYSADFNVIINQLNTDNTLTTVHTNDYKVELFKTEKVVVKGYIYNSSKTINTLVYTLTLVEIDNTFFKNNIDSYSQTELQDTPNQTDIISTMMSKLDINNNADNDADTELNSDSEFGEFQTATPKFTDLDVISPYFSSSHSNSSNSHFSNAYSYPYYSNSYYPCNSSNSYTKYTPLDYYNSYDTCVDKNIKQSINTSYNPFINVNTLRGDTELYINKGSQVPTNPTNLYNNELISELKLRLTQLNSGLKPTSYLI